MDLKGRGIALVAARCDSNALYFQSCAILLTVDACADTPGASHLVHRANQNYKCSGFQWRRKVGPAVVQLANGAVRIMADEWNHRHEYFLPAHQSQLEDQRYSGFQRR